MNEPRECIGLMGKIFGHKYVGRYTRNKPRMGSTLEVEGISVKEALKLISDRVYEGDVCTRCGHKVKKDN